MLFPPHVAARTRTCSHGNADRVRQDPQILQVVGDWEVNGTPPGFQWGIGTVTSSAQESAGQVADRSAEASGERASEPSEAQPVGV